MSLKSKCLLRGGGRLSLGGGEGGGGGGVVNEGRKAPVSGRNRCHVRDFCRARRDSCSMVTYF